MERKKKIKIIEILLLILVIVTTFIIGDTYSKYKEQINTYYRVDMKKWFLKVNEKDIYQETSLTTIVEPEFVDNEYVNDNILAPGSELYFDMDVDYSGINIKFAVTFKVEILNENALSDFAISKYVIGDVTTTPSRGATYFYTTIEPTLDTSVTSTNITTYLKWYDGTNNEMDNLADTKFRGEAVDGADNTKLRFKVTATFEQVV